MSKLNWSNLTKEERAQYMALQMSPSYGGNGGSLPDDCSECPVCGYPVLGHGRCASCSNEYTALRDKLEEKAND